MRRFAVSRACWGRSRWPQPSSVAFSSLQLLRSRAQWTGVRLRFALWTARGAVLMPWLPLALFALRVWQQFEPRTPAWGQRLPRPMEPPGRSCGLRCRQTLRPRRRLRPIRRGRRWRTTRARTTPSSRARPCTQAGRAAGAWTPRARPHHLRCSLLPWRPGSLAQLCQSSPRRRRRAPRRAATRARLLAGSGLAQPAATLGTTMQPRTSLAGPEPPLPWRGMLAVRSRRRHEAMRQSRRYFPPLWRAREEAAPSPLQPAPPRRPLPCLRRVRLLMRHHRSPRRRRRRLLEVVGSGASEQLQSAALPRRPGHGA